ncbi:hypothetical protein M2157_004921 [Streptomyces sp. SAI-127]|nr:hypothetical protein [Streptomyces sp. SAI-127]
MSSGRTRVPRAMPRGRRVGGDDGRSAGTRGAGRDDVKPVYSADPGAADQVNLWIHEGSLAEELPTTAEIAKPGAEPAEPLPAMVGRPSATRPTRCRSWRSSRRRPRSRSRAPSRRNRRPRWRGGRRQRVRRGVARGGAPDGGRDREARRRAGGTAARDGGAAVGNATDAVSLAEGLPTAAEIAKPCAEPGEPPHAEAVGHVTVRWRSACDGKWLYPHRGRVDDRGRS